jgi:N-acetylornithine carbamoyltransferase
MQSFNDLSELSLEEIDDLLALAGRLRETPEPRALEGKVLGLMFLSPSLRTQMSFQAAMVRLGGGSFIVSPDRGIHKLETRSGVVMNGDAVEHVREAIPVIASYADALGIRAFALRQNLDDDLADRDFRALADLSPVPVINMESAIRHPCQSLADWKTMDDLSVPRRGGKLVLSWAYHPKPLPLAVAASTVQMAALRGMEVTVARPEGFELPHPIMKAAREAASASGGSIVETADVREALEGAHVLYAKSWSATACYGDDEADRELRGGLVGWRVDSDWFESSAKDCRFMHCLPVRRGVVVTEEVLEGARSVVLQQANNRMWAQMALLYRIMGSRREAR